MVAEVGFCGTWDLQKRKHSVRNTVLVLVYALMSFPLIYRFAGTRRVLTELEADN